MVASSTTSDKEIGQNSLLPAGCGRYGPASLLLLLADAFTSTRCCPSNQGPFRPQQMACYFWDRTLEYPYHRFQPIVYEEMEANGNHEPASVCPRNNGCSKPDLPGPFGEGRKRIKGNAGQESYGRFVPPSPFSRLFQGFGSLQAALGTQPQGCWRLIDYETDRFPGVMLFAGQETEAQEVTYSLVVKGWHDIYIGMFNTQGRAYEALGFWAKLKDDPAYSFLYVAKPGGEVDPTAQRSGSVPLDDALKGPRLQDVYWKTADLTSQTLSFNQACSRVVPESQQYGSLCGKIWVAYIKLVPLSEEELEALLQDRSRTDTKRLFGHHDSWSPHWNRTGSAGTSEASIQADLEPFRHSDFARIYWDGVHGDVCNYFTKIGRMWTPE